MLSAARFFFDTSFACFLRTLVSLANESSFVSPFLDLDDFEELEDELDEDVEEEEGVTPREDEEEDEDELLEDEVLEIRLDEPELEESPSSLEELFCPFFFFFFFFLASFLSFPDSRLRCFLFLSSSSFFFFFFLRLLEPSLYHPSSSLPG